MVESFAPQWVNHTQIKVVQTATQVGVRHAAHTGGQHDGHADLPAALRRFAGWGLGQANRTRLIGRCARVESGGGVSWRTVVPAPDQ